MFTRILLPTDGSDVSRQAVEKGVELAKAVDATVIGFFAPMDYSAQLYSEYIPPNLMSRDEFEANARQAAERQLAVVERIATAAGVPYESHWIASAAPWRAIVDAAKTKGCDLIFIAPHGRAGLGALMLGSQTMRVLTHSEIPVLVYR